MRKRTKKRRKSAELKFQQEIQSQDSIFSSTRRENEEANERLLEELSSEIQSREDMHQALILQEETASKQQQRLEERFRDRENEMRSSEAELAIRSEDQTRKLGSDFETRLEALNRNLRTAYSSATRCHETSLYSCSRWNAKVDDARFGNRCGGRAGLLRIKLFCKQSTRFERMTA